MAIKATVRWYTRDRGQPSIFCLAKAIGWTKENKDMNDRVTISDWKLFIMAYYPDHQLVYCLVGWSMQKE